MSSVPTLGELWSKVTPEGYTQLVTALKANGATTANGLVSYTVSGYGTLTLADATAKTKSSTTGPQALGGGWDGWRGPYVSFNRVDQGALLAGGGAALAAAICAIPAVGQVACVVAAALVAIAFYYLNEYGRCPTSRPNLRVYVWSRNLGCYS